jgi:hypothetical protein
VPLAPRVRARSEAARGAAADGTLALLQRAGAKLEARAVQQPGTRAGSVEGARCAGGGGEWAGGGLCAGVGRVGRVSSAQGRAAFEVARAREALAPMRAGSGSGGARAPDAVDLRRAPAPRAGQSTVFGAGRAL